MDRTLVLVPTQAELDYLHSTEGTDDSPLQFALCGFGPVAAACRAMHLLCSASYSRVLLCGLAGAYSDELAVGDAVSFRSVTIDGVGAIEGGRLRSGYDLGFDTSIPDVLATLVPLPGAPCAENLLTACVCSGSASEAAGRAAAYPGAAAEDMEGYGVAMACHLRNVPLTILRGISNRAGERDKRYWRIRDALDSVRSVLIRPWRP